ncbi:MAG TPA: tetratricopeptide repeat protein [Chryseolinea sp.]
MGVDEDPSKRDSVGKSRIYYLIGYAFLVAMALFWSVDSSIVYIFLGLACFFLFLGFNSRPKSVEKSYSRSYRTQGQREYAGSTESVEDKIKQFFQRKTTTSTARPTDAMAKGRKIVLAIGIGFFVLFTIPFVIALFGSDGSSDSISYYMAAQQHFDEQQYDSAYIEYRRALTIDPEYVEAIVGYGDVLVIRDERDSAIFMFDRALEINPDYREATYKKAAAWFDQKKYNDAIGILTPLLIDNPDYYNAVLLMGDCYYVQKNFVDALAWYENAYQNVDVRNANLCYLIGYIYETNENFEKAIELYKETLTYDDSIADIYERLGRLLPGAEGDAYRAKAIELKK